jgi:hypothetical protein
MKWSYSSLKLFQQCPKKYYHLKIAKDVAQQETTATNYGKEVHKAAEDYISKGIPVNPKYKYMVPILESLENIDGDKYCEMELGIGRRDGKYYSCEFDAEDYWWHGIVDLLIVNGDTAYMVDYKTNKNARFADLKQLDYMASAVFLKFPKVLEIKSALVFVVSGEFVQKIHTRAFYLAYLESAMLDLNRLEAATTSGVWNPVSGPLCKFCPVKDCAHNRS